MQGAAAAVERVFREEYGRLIASLVARFCDIDIAEETAVCIAETRLVGRKVA